MNINQLKLLSSAVVLASVLTGCNQYEVSKDSQGRTIRLNKSTGEVTVIEGGKLIVPKTEEQAKAEADAVAEAIANESKKLTERRSWGTLRNILGTNVTLTSIYMNGALRYQASFGKKPRGFNFLYGQSLSVLFLKNGIKVYDSVGKVNRSVDSNGNDISIILTGTVPMTEDDYKNLDSYNIEWHGIQG